MMASPGQIALALLETYLDLTWYLQLSFCVCKTLVWTGLKLDLMLSEVINKEYFSLIISTYFSTKHKTLTYLVFSKVAVGHGFG